MVRETTLGVQDLIDPLFVVPGAGRERRPIGAMPGVFQMTVDALRAEAEQIAKLGLPAVLLFGLPEAKDEQASGAWDDDGIVQRAVRALKADNPQLLVFADVCLCEYMSHGHCGIVQGDKILNDPTLDLLARTAVSHAAAGADVVAPSDMMDGRVAALRRALDAQGFADTPILSYAAKYASAFYGPFREAADSAPSSATAAPTRWTPPTVARRSRKSPRTSPRARTWSWSSPHWPSWTSSGRCAN